MRQDWKPGTLIYPLPAILVSCGSRPEDYNLLTASWVGTICSQPPMCYVSIRPERHSYALIKESGEFGLNLTTVGMARQTDWCGVRSGKDYDKFAETGLTVEPAKLIKAPLVAESPVSIECGRSFHSVAMTCLWPMWSISVPTNNISTRRQVLSIWRKQTCWHIRMANTSRLGTFSAISAGRSRKTKRLSDVVSSTFR